MAVSDGQQHMTTARDGQQVLCELLRLSLANIVRLVDLIRQSETSGQMTQQTFEKTHAI